jgi:hypothetical protein
VQPERNSGAEPQASSTQAGKGDVWVDNSARTKDIGRRAYETYLERGEQPGRELVPSRTRTRRWGAREGGLGS